MKRLLIVLLLALPLMAQHRVSRIQVNSTVPSRILLSQSALVEGRSYTDADLEVAVARLRRLPFVYEARYRLDGETLVLDVEGMSRLFADLDAAGAAFEGDQTGTAAIGAGGRLFLGSGGVAQFNAVEHVNEADDAQSLAAEYSHYGIGGTRLFATAGFNQFFGQPDHVDVDPELHLTVGYPLTIRSTITASVRTAGFESNRAIAFLPVPISISAEQRLFDLRYTYDTTEDPYFARRGLLVTGGPSYADEDSQFDSILFVDSNGNFEVIRSVTDGSTTELGVEATKFWPFRERGTFFGMAHAAWRQQEFDTQTDDPFPFPVSGGEVESNDYGLAAGYGHNLASRQRLEFILGATRRNFSRGDFFPGRSDSFDSKSATAAYVLRRPFATVRLSLGYTFD